MSNENILNLSDENKSIIRNYAMVAGFFMMFITLIIPVASLFAETTSDYSIPHIIGAIVLMVCGIVLALLHKRDQVAITFLFVSLALLLLGFKNMILGDGVLDYSFGLIVGIVSAMLGIMMLCTRNEQRYICAALLLIYGITALVGVVSTPAGDIQTVPPELTSVDAGAPGPALYGLIGQTVMALLSLYAAITIGLENPQVPGYRILTADEDDESADGSPVHFKVTGAILGFMLFATPMLAFTLYYAGVGNISVNQCAYLESFCGMMLVVTGLIMLVAGRMRFTPFLFIMLGAVTSLTAYLGEVGWLNCIFLVFIGILTIFRSDRRLLVGLAIVIYAISYIFTDLISIISSPAVSIILNIVPFVILSYVCFALCSDNRLKLI